AAAPSALIFQSSSEDQELIWVDRSGKRLGTVGEPGPWVDFTLSPDEQRLALMRLDSDGRAGHIWILDLALGTTSRITSESDGDYMPVWSRDGKRVTF